MSLAELINHREALSRAILVQGDDVALGILAGDWPNARILIENWWAAFKKWEASDTFNDAIQDDRMTMRTFGDDFAKQVNKSISTITIATPARFFADSNYTRFQPQQQQAHDAAFKTAPTGTYQAKRGINSSEFSNPANFASRVLKYQHGLHDLSVKLVMKNSDLKAQSHHSGSAKPHFSFLPISKPEDQEVIYKLNKYAKALRGSLGDLYNLIHGYRARMTRVKLANDYDMGTGYHAMPVANPGNGPAYKVRYGMGNNYKVRDQKLPKVTNLQYVQTRQKAYFENKASIVRSGNEIVIAIRHHAGPFPVMATYETAHLKCFDLQDNNKVENNKTISHLGVASW